MSKITKKDLQHQINRLYAADSTRNNKMLRMQRALSSLGVDIMSDEFDKPSEPKLKVLDQSVFDELDEKWQFAAVDKDGRAYGFMKKPVIDQDDPCFINGDTTRYKWIGEDYNASDWQNSLIERESLACEEADFLNDTISNIVDEIIDIEYFYSNITSALLESGSKLVVCFVSNVSESNALSNKRIEVITSLDTGFDDTDGYGWQYAVPINNQGEPLTAKEVGL